MGVFYLISKFLKKIQISAVKNSELDSTSKVCSASHIVDSHIDKYSYVGNYCAIVNVDIGKYCSIADNCIIGGSSHPIGWVSTSPVFHKGKNIMKKNFSKHEFKTTEKTDIENDVWIGANCIIKSGVSIATGAIIGMGSVLTKDVGPYEIWGGNPAKFIRKRFDDNTIKRLLNSEWWNMEESKLINEAKNINNVEKFLQDYEEHKK